MTINMGKIDRGLRLAVAAALVWIATATGTFGTGAMFWIALAVAAVFTITALLGNCPLYSLVGIRTCRSTR